MTATATATPAEIDSDIAVALGALYAAHEALLRNDRLADYGERYAAQAETEHPLLLAAWKSAHETFLVQEARYEGWSRFYLVVSSDGHIHRHTNCTTCYATTRYGWLTELSGQTEAEAVAEYGALLCSECFPTAPAAYRDGSTLGRRTQAARDARAAEKAARHRAKLLKSLTDDVDRGLVFKMDEGRGGEERITTLASARANIKRALEYKYRYDGYWQFDLAEERVVPVARALADRLAELAERFPEAGVKVETAEAIVDRYRAQALKDRKKDGR